VSDNNDYLTQVNIYFISNLFNHWTVFRFYLTRAKNDEILPPMSINLKFQKGSLVMQVLLHDEALPELLEIISKHQSDEAAPASLPLSAPGLNAPGSQTPSSDPSKDVKDWMTKHSASEVLNAIQWDKHQDKILLLGAFHEANGGKEGWRSADMDERFSEAKELFPPAFPRNIRDAIKEGGIAPVTDRTYKVSRTGWNKIADAITKISA
jgi:hypothetical protein